MIEGDLFIPSLAICELSEWVCSVGLVGIMGIEDEPACGWVGILLGLEVKYPVEFTGLELILWDVLENVP